MGMALAKLAEEDPTFTVRTDDQGKLLSQVWVSFTWTS
jgi:translation elongation factor EF-G